MTNANTEAANPSITDTIQSLIVGFVLAMTVRAFVCEGFVIPTGSMAPTLLGRHVAIRSPQTGTVFPVGVDARIGDDRFRGFMDRVADPWLGIEFPGSGVRSGQMPHPRSGDRILVHKSLYLLKNPARYDVVVFKNPTNPLGEDGNYIKRLVGLPGETVWLVDGDVFTAPTGDDTGDLGLMIREAESLRSRAGQNPSNRDALRGQAEMLEARIRDIVSGFQIQRKPDHVQRAIWQPFADAERRPRRLESLEGVWHGGGWVGEGWTMGDDGVARAHGTDPAQLEWEPRVRMVNDWAPYNQLTSPMSRNNVFTVADVRVSATVTPDDASLDLVFQLHARRHVFEFIVRDGGVMLRMRSADWDDEFPDEGWEGLEAAVPFRGFRAGRPVNLEFWHVDQRMAVYIGGRLAAEYMYDWDPAERLEHAVGRGDLRETAAAASNRPVQMRWVTSGSPVSLQRLRIDRDVHYRFDRLMVEAARRNPTQEGYRSKVDEAVYAHGTHPDNLAVLQHDQFFMLGDNSAASSDSRLWGNPHPIVAEQVDRAPYVVHRSLILGKAWVVYFPSPIPVQETGRRNVIPDFGSMRFIR